MEPPTLPSTQPRRHGPKPTPYGSSPSSQLHLSSLPRFHPANYKSTSSSMAASPSSSVTSPNDQRHLSYYHQHLVAQASMATSPAGALGKKPLSPKLAPLMGSPGPVTPLELDGDSYMTAGASSKKSSLASVDAIIREKAKRHGDASPRMKT